MEKAEVVVNQINDSSELQEFSIDSDCNFFIAANLRYEDKDKILMPEAIRFYKWLRRDRSELKVGIEDATSITLHSVDYWMPLIYVANEVSLPLVINCIYDYIKHMAKGKLNKDENTAHVNIRYKDNDKLKELNYKGPVEGLPEINKMMNKFKD